MERKQRLLIADDSEMNQELLTEILGEGYEYAYASNGMEVVETLAESADIDLLLLDINMPELDGFGVLEVMKRRQWLEEVPVIIISAESDAGFIRKAYDLGATDYINRPFNMTVVQRRVSNTLMLYARQKRLVQLVEDQVYEREKNNSTMISILSHVIESRNNESGAHTLHVRTITDLLLHQLTQVTERYALSETEISTISTLSALHDIGKITVPEEVLNKPGKLTPQEWEIMKNHTLAGDALLKDAPISQDDPILKTAHAICRWHHERWDGRGYPDGLKGDEIPISAQAVALADVYDALTSERCYKAAYSHDEAIHMILNGACGAFNPLLLDCLRAVAGQLQSLMQAAPERFDFQSEAQRLTSEVLESQELAPDDRSRWQLSTERARANFFAGQCGGIQFEYDKWLHRVILTDYYAEPHALRKVIYLDQNYELRIISRKDWQILADRMRSVSRKHPQVEMKVQIAVRGTLQWHQLTARAIFPDNDETYDRVLGQFERLPETEIPEYAGILSTNDQAVARAMEDLRKIFTVVRLVDPQSCRVLQPNSEGGLKETGPSCFEIWGKGQCCDNCSSKRAQNSKDWTSKLELKNGELYFVLSKYLEVAGRNCVLEIASQVEENQESGTWRPVPNNAGLVLLNFCRDSLTRAYSRMYLDNFRTGLEGAEGVAFIDVDHFKVINDTYGHDIGDAALRRVTDTVLSCVRDKDILIRYGGDEFVLVFLKIEEDVFFKRLKQIKKAVHETELPENPEVPLEISIGGVYGVRPLSEAIRQADQKMYEDKPYNKRNEPEQEE